MSARRAWLWSIVVLFVLNGLFTLAALATNLLPQDRLVHRVREAFASGALIQQDYLPFDASRGWHQYNDCNILQMLTNDDASSAGRAFGPQLFFVDETTGAACPTLHAIVVEGHDPRTLTPSRYARYWHGYIPVTGAALTVMELGTVRNMFRVGIHAALVLLLVAGIARREFLGLAAATALGGLAFWGLPYFGQGLTHALGDIVTVLGLAAMILGIRRWSWLAVLPFCAAYGALVTYFDMLTGSLPTAAGVLVPTVYILSRTSSDSAGGPSAHIARAAGGLAAFAAGVVVTVSIKVGLAAAFVRPSDMPSFFGNLDLYTTPLGADSGIPGIIWAGGRLIRKGTALTYGSNVLLAVLGLITVAAWSGAAWLAFGQRNRLARADLAAFATGAMAVPAWVILLQTHTFTHAAFMTRILLVPIVLGWAAFVWQVKLWRNDHDRPVPSKATVLHGISESNY